MVVARICGYSIFRTDWSQVATPVAVARNTVFPGATVSAGSSWNVVPAASPAPASARSAPAGSQRHAPPVPPASVSVAANGRSTWLVAVTVTAIGRSSPSRWTTPAGATSSDSAGNTAIGCSGSTAVSTVTPSQV